jgi:hypothetical protein
LHCFLSTQAPLVLSPTRVIVVDKLEFHHLPGDHSPAASFLAGGEPMLLPTDLQH